MRNLTASNRRALLATALVFVVFLACSIAFLFSVARGNEQRIQQYLTDATTQRRDAVLQEVDSDFQILRGVALALGDMDLTDSEPLYELLRQINVSNDFIYMGLAGLSGIADMVPLEGPTRQDVSLAALPVFQTALAGQEAFSETFYDRRIGTYVNYFTVPVWQDGAVAAVLCGVNDQQVFADILGVPVFQGEGWFAIIDSQANMIAPLVDPRSGAQLSASLYDIATFTEEENTALQAALEGYRAGALAFSLNGWQQLAVLTPLGAGNGWFILSATPRASINNYYNQTAMGMALLIGVACLVFLFLLYRQISQAAKTRVQLEQLAYTDALTGARSYQKFLLDAAALQARHPQLRYVVWNFDIKAFSRINDVFSSGTGDAVLRRVSEEFATWEQRDPRRIFCRVAADQFTGFMPYDDIAEVQAWFDELMRGFGKRRVIPKENLRIDFAMGVFCPAQFEGATPVDEMVNRAALAKKKAKEQAGNVLAFFTPQMGDELHWQAMLEAAAPQALQNGEIVFFLQPKVSIAGEGFTVHGAEVLARWRHPQHGWLAPGQFIPLFEANGFIAEVDRALFRQACAWYVQCQARGCLPIRLAINVSRQGMVREDFIQHYTAVRHEFGIPAGVLELEFTESLIMEDYDFFQCIVQSMQDNGFLCSIDDFGAGYSSLNVLKNLSIDVLKLDAVFFHDSVDRRREETVVAGFIQLAHALGIRTVAEGVEEEQQVRFLQSVGCDLVQGYIFSKPLPPGEFEALLAEHNGAVYLPEAEKGE